MQLILITSDKRFYTVTSCPKNSSGEYTLLENSDQIVSCTINPLRLSTQVKYSYGWGKMYLGSTCEVVSSGLYKQHEWYIIKTRIPESKNESEIPSEYRSTYIPDSSESKIYLLVWTSEGNEDLCIEEVLDHSNIREYYPNIAFDLADYYQNTIIDYDRMEKYYKISIEDGNTNAIKNLTIYYDIIGKNQGT